MKFKATWILLGIAVAAGAYFFLVEQPRHQQEQQAASSERRLTSLAPDRVSNVRIERPDATFAFVPTDDGWQLTEPVRDAVEAAKVNTLVRSITNADIERRFTDVTDLADYGLDTPTATVILRDGDRHVAVAVGDLTLTKTHCYIALVEDGPVDEVLIAPAGIRRYATRTLYDFRDKRVIRLEAEEVVRFTLASPKGDMTWSREGGGPWRTDLNGEAITGDVNEVEAVMRELRGLRASEVLPRDDGHLSQMGPPSGTVTIEGAGRPPLVITLGQPNENSVYIAVDGRDRISRVNASVLHIFDKTIDDLRDRRLLRFALSDAAAITIETDTGGGSIVKEGDQWSYANPTLGTINQDAVLLFITILQNFRFREVLDGGVPGGGEFDIGHAPVRIAVTATDGRIIDEFEAGENRPGNLRYAFSRGLVRWGVIDEEPLADLLARFEAFRVQ